MTNGGGLQNLLLRIAVSVLPIALAFSAGCARMDGVVKNSRGLHTIPDAMVRAECRKNNLFHGSSVLKTVETRTDDRGVFRFKSADLAPCDFMFVTAAKTGYVMTSSVDTRYAYTDYEKIPAEIFLTPADALRLQYLEYEYVNTKGKITKYSGEPYPEGAYHRVFTGFHCSKRIAETPDEIRYVRENYCERLRNLEVELSNSAREQLPTRVPELCARGGPAEKVNLQEVYDFCGFHRAD